MKDEEKTKEQLISELVELRRRITELEAAEAKPNKFTQTTDYPATGMIGYSMDLTDRKQAEEKLRQQNEYLAALHETTLGLMNRLELDNLLESMGDEEILLLNQFAELASVALNNARLYTTAQQELAERRRVEQALRESEECYRSVVEQTADGIYLIDIDTRRVLESNPAFQKLLGYTSKELLGMTHYDFIAHDRESIDLNVQHILTKKHHIIGERQYRRKNGSLVDVENHASLISYGGREVICAVVRDITERKRAEEQLKAALKEKEVLLKEVHHRVKNNLQVVSSLLTLQSEFIQDPQTLQLFRESQNRVRSMALIHERLYRSSNLSKIDFAEYIQDLTTCLFHSYEINSFVTLKMNVDHVFLDVDTAITCGLIINELVSNSLKYAFPEGQQGEIYIEFRSDGDGMVILKASDNGVGLPRDIDFRNTESLGLQLVTALTDQLKGSIQLDTSSGTAFKITFKSIRG